LFTGVFFFFVIVGRQCLRRCVFSIFFFLFDRGLGGFRLVPCLWLKNPKRVWLPTYLTHPSRSEFLRVCLKLVVFGSLTSSTLMFSDLLRFADFKSSCLPTRRYFMLERVLYSLFRELSALGFWHRVGGRSIR